MGQNRAHVAVLLITCVSPHTVSHRIAISSSGPCPPAVDTTASAIFCAAPVFVIAMPSGVMKESRKTACMSNAANASFCVITLKSTTAMAATHAVMCIGGRAFQWSAEIIRPTAVASSASVSHPRQSVRTPSLAAYFSVSSLSRAGSSRGPSAA